jgi:orotidine-5'-phosphate decarboxylase
MTFQEKLQRAQQLTRSCVCVGLDPVPGRLPQPFQGEQSVDGVRRFCEAIIQTTRSVACAYKPNLAFFESLGPDGLRVLADVVAAIPEDRIILADAKRGDIGNTAEMYARAFFETLSCDACTVTPYMGRDAVLPFLNYPGKAVFVLTRTSNPGAADFQDLVTDSKPLYLHVAEQASAWASDRPGTVGFVVGATDLDTLASMRRQFPDTPFLIPGVGAQGGDPVQVMQAVHAPQGLVLVNSSRKILYASSGSDFAEAAFYEADTLRKALNKKG